MYSGGALNKIVGLSLLSHKISENSEAAAKKHPRFS